MVPPRPGNEYHDAMRDVLDHAARVDQSNGPSVAPKPSLLTRPPVVGVVFLAFAATVWLNVRRARQEIPELPPADAVVSAEVTTMMASELVRRHQEEHGSLPASLADVGLDAGQFDYRPGTDGHFELSARVGESEAAFDSRAGPAGRLRDLGVPLGPPPTGGNQ